MLWEKKAHDEEEVADQLYARMEAERAVQTQRSRVNVPETIRVDTVMEDLTVYQYSTADKGIEGEPGTPPAQTYAEQVKDQVQPIPDRSAGLQSGVKESSGTMINRFDILRQSPYSSGNPIPMDVALPGGTFYRIQLGAFSTPVEPDAFGGISPITGESLRDRGLIKYYAGKFSRYDDASTGLSMIRSSGYEDAFIVAWYNGSPVSTQKAKQLE